MTSQAETAEEDVPTGGDVKLTVVLVTYNHEAFIARALDSVLGQQTTFNFEVIVSEDCSTDATRSIVEEYAARHGDQVRLMLSERNLNSNMVEGRGILSARGEYVAVMDGDDYLLPLKLQKQVDYLDSHPGHAMCYHNAHIIRGCDDTIVAPFVKPDTPRISDLASSLARNHVPGSSAMFRTNALRPLPHWFGDAPFGDWSSFIIAAQHGPIGYIDETLSVYRKHAGGNWSARSRPQQFRALMQWYDYLQRHLPEHLSEGIARGRDNHRCSPWYVTSVGEAFLALIERGARTPEGWCARSISLSLEARQAMTGLRVHLANPDFDPRFARNSLEVKAGEATAVREGLRPGESCVVEFQRPLAVGESLALEVRSARSLPLDGKGPPRYGFRLLRVEPIGRGA